MEKIKLVWIIPIVFGVAIASYGLVGMNNIYLLESFHFLPHFLIGAGITTFSITKLQEIEKK